MLSWPHTGFNVHSLVRAKTKPEAERVGKLLQVIYQSMPENPRLSSLEMNGIPERSQRLAERR